MKHIINLLLILFLLNSNVYATQDPYKLIQDTIIELQAALRGNEIQLKNNPSALYNLIDKVAVPHFDFRRMSKLVLSKYWKNTTKKQKNDFVEEFRAFLIRAYANTWVTYIDEDITFLPRHDLPGDERIKVRTLVKNSVRNVNIAIDYEMYLKNDEWKIFNVNVEHVSLVINYRNSFADDIEQNGIDGLIRNLASRTYYIETDTSSKNDNIKIALRK
jgi:phospholipid transport system substrate-binding protein